MSNDNYQRVLYELAEMRRLVGQMVRVGTVKEVKKDKMRMTLGKDSDGKEILGPWLDTNNHRGGSRERRFYKEGQNLTMLCPNGDPRQAVIMPYAPNKDHPPPDHSNDTGQGEETYQQDGMKVSKGGDGYDIWTDSGGGGGGGGGSGKSGGASGGSGGGGGGQSQGSGQSQGGGERNTGGGKAQTKMRLNHSTGFTGRGYTTESRVASREEGAKIKRKPHHAVVTKENPIVSKPWVIDKDPVPDDDK